MSHHSQKCVAVTDGCTNKTPEIKYSRVIIVDSFSFSALRLLAAVNEDGFECLIMRSLEEVDVLGQIGDVIFLSTRHSADLAQHIAEVRLQLAQFYPVIAVGDTGVHSTVMHSLAIGASDIVDRDPSKGDVKQVFTRLNTILSESVGQARQTWRAERKVGKLSPRERQVLALINQGQSNKEIAITLEISPRTVEIHRAKMLHRLGVTNTRAAINLAASARLKFA